MFFRLLSGCVLVAVAAAQPAPAPVELANLREDVRGLTQRVGDLELKIEQLERENAELRRGAPAPKNTVTLAQLNDNLADLERSLRGAIATSKTETLQQVNAQLEKISRQLSAAAAAETAPVTPAKPVTASTPAHEAGSAGFSDDFPKEGIKYTVQKGDTLGIIAKKTGAKQADIVNANKLSDPSHIVPGQSLFIPLQPVK